MPRIPRRLVLHPGDAFHTIWRCYNEEYLLQAHLDKRAYLQAVHDDYLSRCPGERFSINVYCIMSTHGHIRHSLKQDLKSFSEHLRRAHCRFGIHYNKRHGRLGPVAHGRPKTICLENEKKEIRCDLYILCNPVRAGIVKHPSDAMWKDFSCCRYLAYGKKNRFDDMLELPDWYLKLGKTPRQRQRKFRSMLDKYLVEEGMKRDSTMSTGHFCGSPEWVAERRVRLRECKKLAAGPPDTDTP